MLGSTGLCGAAYLRAACESSVFKKVWAFSRHELPKRPKLENIVSTDSTNWAAQFPKANVVFSGLATTRAAAGGLGNQYKIDHDLNVELAHAAKKAGCTTYILVSSGGANENSFMHYLKMKGDTEKDISNIGFDKTVFLQPGPLLGKRQGNFKGFGNNVIEKVGAAFYKSPVQFLLGYPVYEKEVAAAALWAVENLPSGVHRISSKEIQEISNSNK